MDDRKAPQILAYWLIPAEPAHTFFAELISDLCARFDAPLFDPHVTVYVSKAGEENPDDVLSRALHPGRRFELRVRDIQCSEEFTKSVFVQFEPDEQLSRLCRRLRDASEFRDEYHLNPHLSLIYKEMALAKRREIAASIRIPFCEVRFDSAKAVISPAQISSGRDVERWRVAATQLLPEGG